MLFTFIVGISIGAVIGFWLSAHALLSIFEGSSKKKPAAH